MTAADGCPVMLDILYAVEKGSSRPLAGRESHGQGDTRGLASKTRGRARSEREREDFPEDPNLHTAAHAAVDGPARVAAPVTSQTDRGGEGTRGGACAAAPNSPQRQSARCPPGTGRIRAAVGGSGNAVTESVSAVHVEQEKALGVLLILPGLTSSSQSNYIRRFVRYSVKRRYHVCVLNTRGMGDTPLTTPFLISGSYTEDTRQCVNTFFTPEAVVARFGCVLPVIAVGFSIGGAVLTKYVGEEGRAGRRPILAAAIAVCAPYDFVETVKHMNTDTMQHYVYQSNMCSDVESYFRRHEKVFRNLPNIDADYVFSNMHRFSRVVHYDQHIIVPTRGYRSLHHYHLDSSGIIWIPHTLTPLLSIATADDPVVGPPPMVHRWKEIANCNPAAVFVKMPTGGHLGFLGTPLRELLGRPDPMQVFVLDRVDAVVANVRTAMSQPQLQQLRLVQLQKWGPGPLATAGSTASGGNRKVWLRAAAPPRPLLTFSPFLLSSTTTEAAREQLRRESPGGPTAVSQRVNSMGNGILVPAPLAQDQVIPPRGIPLPDDNNSASMSHCAVVFTCAEASSGGDQAGTEQLSVCSGCNTDSCPEEGCNELDLTFRSPSAAFDEFTFSPPGGALNEPIEVRSLRASELVHADSSVDRAHGASQGAGCSTLLLRDGSHSQLMAFSTYSWKIYGTDATGGGVWPQSPEEVEVPPPRVPCDYYHDPRRFLLPV